MKIYLEYISLHIIKAFALLVFIITSLIVLIQFLAFINYLPNLQVNPYIILKFLALEFPSIFSYTAPIALTCALIYTYHTLYTDNIAPVLESSGISKLRMAIPGIALGVMITIFSLIITMFLEPLSKREIQRFKKSLINSSSSTSMLEARSFNKISQSITLYLDSKNSDGSLSGIIISDHSEKNKQVSFYAEKAELNTIDDAFNLKLVEGSRHEISEYGLTVLYFKNLILPLNTVDQESSSNRYLSLGQKLVFELIGQNSKNPTFSMEMHHRLFLPILNVAVSIITLAAILYGPYERRSDYKKIKRAAFYSLIFTMISIILKNQLWENPWVSIVLYLNIIICCYMGLYVIYKDSENVEIMPKFPPRLGIK